VNDELGNLEGLLAAVERGSHHRGTEALRQRGEETGRGGWLGDGARVAVIAFHSLEDRPVKQAFSRLVSAGVARDLTGGHVGAGEEEIRRNPRAGSAKLRAVELARDGRAEAVGGVGRAGTTG
jgi:hypothetical protein